jgi:hypothetical protein
VAGIVQAAAKYGINPGIKYRTATIGTNMRNRRNPAPSERLARLFSIVRGDFIGWDDAELARVLQEQLRAPLFDRIKPRAGEVHDSLGKAQSSKSPLPETIAELLTHPHPPLPLLRRTKEFAKSADAGKEPLPPAVATAIYLLSIASALVRHGKKISAIDERKLLDSLQWVGEQAWIDESLRKLAAEAAGKLLLPNHG